MKKIINKRLLIFVIIFAIFTPIITYALGLQTQSNKQSSEFFYSDKTVASPGELVTMSIDLAQVEYENFEFLLTSDANISNVTPAESDVDTQTENNSLKIISSKSNINMNKIDLYYKIPENVEIGSKISFTGIIQNCSEGLDDSSLEDNPQDSEEENASNDYTENSNVNSDRNDNTNQNESTKEITITINIIEKEDNGNSNDVKNEENKSNEDKNQIQDNSKQSNSAISTKQISTQTNVSKTQGTQSSLKMSSSENSDGQTVIYNGESNNYLSSLIVEGYEITEEFLKTSNTYFINVDKDVTNVNVLATAEEDNARITIYGNDNIKEGENKILISVTAENGEVRVYRVYVTK